MRWVYGTFYHDFMPYHRPDLMWSCLPIRTDLISSGIFFQAIPWHDLECVFITVYVSSVSYLKCLLRARLNPVCPTLQVQTQCLRSGYAVNIATDLKSLCESSVIPFFVYFCCFNYRIFKPWNHYLSRPFHNTQNKPRCFAECVLKLIVLPHSPCARHPQLWLSDGHEHRSFVGGPGACRVRALRARQEDLQDAGGEPGRRRRGQPPSGTLSQSPSSIRFPHSLRQGELMRTWNRSSAKELSH